MLYHDNKTFVRFGMAVSRILSISTENVEKCFNGVSLWCDITRWDVILEYTSLFYVCYGAILHLLCNITRKIPFFHFGLFLWVLSSIIREKENRDLVFDFSRGGNFEANIYPKIYPWCPYDFIRYFQQPTVH